MSFHGNDDDYRALSDALDAAARKSAHKPLVPSQEVIDKRTTGIYGKFIVTRTDGKSEAGQKHDGYDYFVLDITHDPHAVPALRAYAQSCEADYPLLAKDLRANGPTSQGVPSQEVETARQALKSYISRCCGAGITAEVSRLIDALILAVASHQRAQIEAEFKTEYGYESSNLTAYIEDILEDRMQHWEKTMELQARIEALEQENETLNIKLAACSTAALGNTPASVVQRIQPGHPYYSASYGDVCRAVDGEIEARTRAESAERERDALRAEKANHA